MEKHKHCPDENSRCQHGDDEHCPALARNDEILALAQKIVSDYEVGAAKDKARGYHKLDGALMTDEVRLAQEVLRLTALL